MHNPPHPGDVLRDGVFADTGITPTEELLPGLDDLESGHVGRRFSAPNGLRRIDGAINLRPPIKVQLRL